MGEKPDRGKERPFSLTERTVQFGFCETPEGNCYFFMVLCWEDVLYIGSQKLLRVIDEARTGWVDSSEEISPKDLVTGRKIGREQRGPERTENAQG